jgi:hypothetical protein
VEPEDWTTCEMRPAGEEIITLLSGRATLVVDTPDGNAEIELSRMGETIVLPAARGTRHARKG